MGGPEGALFALERVEHETGGAFGPGGGAISEKLKPEKAFVPESEVDESGEDSSDDESEPELDLAGQSGAHQEVPAAVRALYYSLTGVPQPITRPKSSPSSHAPLSPAHTHLPARPPARLMMFRFRILRDGLQAPK